MRIIQSKLSPDIVRGIMIDEFGDMAKVDVDIERGVLTIGGEWHSEGQDELVEKGSDGSKVWGCNYYAFREPEKRIEYNSLINIKPGIGHTSMDVKENDVKEKMKNIIELLLLSSDETIQR